jgi:hypothetical protein
VVWISIQTSVPKKTAEFALDNRRSARSFQHQDVCCTHRLVQALWHSEFNPQIGSRTKKEEAMMKRVSLVVGSLCLIVAIVVFVFADGLRRWYSGLFFLLIGVISFANYLRWRRDSKSQNSF